MTALLENLIQSKVKRKLLRLFLFNTSKEYHTRQLSRMIEEPISAVQRELKKLVNLQIITKSPKGNTIKYQVNQQNPFYSDLKNIILKTTTEPAKYFDLLIKTPSLKLICLFGETLKNPMNFSSPIQLLIVGDISIDTLKEYITALLEIFNREYNLNFYTEKNFRTAITNDAQLQTLLNSKHLLILKKELEF